MRVAQLVSLIVCVFAGGIAAQQPADPGFEIVSVKRNASGELGGRNGIEPNAYVGINVTLRRMIALAYQPLPNAQIVGGPDWMNAGRFDVRATFTGTPTRPQLQAMMRAMIADRFKLRTHMESRPTRVYLLTVARPGTLGPSLKPATVDCSNPAERAQRAQQARGASGTAACGFQYTDGLIRGGGVTLDQVAGELTAGRTVVNRTGLAGDYDVELRWTPDATAPPADDAPPTLATALREQLGLKLESGTLSMDYLVIDGAEQPREN